MIRSQKLLFTLAVLFSLLETNSYAQIEPIMQHAGPSLGLSFLGSGLQIGGNYEYILNVNDFGNVGVGGILRYWTYSENFIGGSWDYTNYVLGVQGNYHFNFRDERFDPWAGLVLAFAGGSVSFNGPSGSNFNTPDQGGFWIAVQGGLRYWLNDKIGFSGRVSFGSLSYGSLEAGVDFKF